MAIFSVKTKGLDLSPKAKQWLSNAVGHLSRALANRDDRYVSMHGAYPGRAKIALSPNLKASFKNLDAGEQKKVAELMGTEIKLDVWANIRTDGDPIILLG